MSVRLAPLLLLFALLLAGIAACDDGDDAPDAGNSPRLSDEDYLKVLCSGTANYSNALATKTQVAEIGQAIKDFVTSLQQVNPPSDLEKFHSQLIKYLQDANSDPTSLVTRKPPLPDDNTTRQRLASKESSVAECRDA